MTITDITKFDTYSFNLLVYKIKNTKSQYDVDFVGGEHFKGFRYNDDERIARMVIGDIFAECQRDENRANSKFISLDSIQMEAYIKRAVLESASCDHYYTFEKMY
jgi:predicted MPP superfamily phosphohydrolase